MSFEKTKINAQSVFKKLRNKGIILREMKQYKIHNALRLTIGKKKANEYFIKNIIKILK